ncbi:site-specific integrase [Rhizobium sp. S96]|uniref:tyrosine-type recombinase/integrase n=1 Tax=Rhizobium sp. S96 TaxID=3055140 RepID=UPI0025AB385C|nr:site-specific integrase [Rhizobium sp. S96]MDM9621121.1 site-specific integrase [Rhizobium sp. S96]
MPRNRAKLTHQFCVAVKPAAGTREYLDGTTRLALRVTPAGSKTWSMRFRAGGTEKRLTFGSFDNVSLGMARKKYETARSQVSNGEDPLEPSGVETAASSVELPERPPTSLLSPPDLVAPPALAPSIRPHQGLAPPPLGQRRAGTLRLAEAGELYLGACEVGRHRPRRKKKLRIKGAESIEGERRAFRRFIEPRLGGWCPDDLDMQTVQDFVDTIEIEDTEGAARLAKKTLHSIYSYALWQGYATRNPCVQVTYPPSGDRKTVLSDEQIRTVWRTFSPPVKVKGAYVSPGMGYAILLAMVLLQRIGEVQQMGLSQIDFRNSLWVIPEDITKNRMLHVVPLPPLAVKLILEALAARGPMDSDAVFPGAWDAQAPVRRGAASRAFTRVKRALKWPDIRLHDLRRTGSTRLAAPPISVPPFVISKLLNHTSDTGGAAPVTSIYNRYEYLAEKREALREWQDELEAILGQ